MKACPTCHRPIGGAGRFCFACRLPVLKNHKWHVVGCYIVHDDCQNPTMRLLVPISEPVPEPGSAPLLSDPQPAAAQEEIQA